MAYLRQVFFRQTVIFMTVLRSIPLLSMVRANFELAFIAAFFDTTLFTELNPLLDAFCSSC